MQAIEDLPNDAAAAIGKLLLLSKQPGWRYRFGTGAITGTLNVISPNICDRSLFGAATNGSLLLPLGWLGDTVQSRQVRDRLALIASDLFGVELRDDLSSFYPSVRQEMWVSKVDQFIAAVTKAVAEVGRSGER